MFESLKFEGESFFRGEIPFFINSQKGSVVYLCSSKKNLNDYYWCLKNFYEGDIIKQEGDTDEEYARFSCNLLEKLKHQKKIVVLVTIDYFLKKYRYSGNSFLLKCGEEIDVKKIIDSFENEGYRKKYLIEERKDYSLRGDIFDFFPVNSENPIRVELSFDSIERITSFDLETQRSIEKFQELNMYIDSNKKEISNFLESFKESSFLEPLCFIENREVIQYKLNEIMENYPEESEELEERFVKGIEKFIQIENDIFSKEETTKYQDYEEIKKLSKEKDIIICSDESRRYKEIFSGYSRIKYYNYPLFEGFENNSILYLTDRELKGIRVKREKKQSKKERYFNITEIKHGDYIIHELYGIGIYKGLVLMENEEYLEIKYADEDRLFVPVNNLDRIEKYLVEPGSEPEIFKLGRKGFRRKRERLQEEITLFAKEIVEIQAKRVLKKGFQFSKDSILQEEFEDGFPYTLTPDQLKAVEDVKRDMETGKIMDRIVCGDVGCGKTEVAMRAAFKSINDYKQVVVMVPTTILAQQHYERFKERLKNYPFTIELLSRIKTEKEQKEIVDRISKGAVDLVIGTHKLLSEEIKFKDLGLVIIDEEQKFGVKAKEKLKHLKDNLDLLTLTATPIPRTLNLALLGIRDISIIETLPPSRLPIKDFYIEQHEKDIRDAIMKEYSREGQVFYLYNSVKTMHRKESELRKILPKFIRVSSIHGQMPPKEIREKLRSFENGEIDLLLTTTIIENGIDVENANTMIIDGMSKLGLSQMYQIRGRVGRGSEQGYCYMLIDKNKDPKTNVKKREESMRGLSEITTGGGFHLSMEDMKIRGAGEVLGDKQHGAIETLGYSLYMKMLLDEVDKLKGDYVESISELTISLKDRGYIPNEYMEEMERVKLYKRVARCKRVSEYSEIKEETRDRFGRFPKALEDYFRAEKIRIIANQEKILEIREQEDGHCYIKFIRELIKIEKIIDLLQKERVKYLKNEDAILYNGTVEEFLEYYMREF